MDLDRYQAMVNYLADRSYPTGYTKDQKRVLRSAVELFVLKGNELYHFRNNMYLDNPQKRIAMAQKVIVGNIEKERIIREAHCGFGGGHFGQSVTKNKVGDKYWWPGFSVDVVDFVRNCDMCQKANPVHKAPASVLRPIAVCNQFNYRWCVDLVGPLAITDRGNQYVAVGTEYLSRFPVIRAIPNKRAETVGRFIFEDIICLFGVMKLLQHDQGREFCNGLMQFMEDKLGVKDVVSTAYHPQTNGLTERFNQTLETALMKLHESDRANWDLHLQPIVFSYRVSIQASTKKTPYEMVFGCKARVPMDAGTVNDEVPDPAENFNDAVAERMLVVSSQLITTREEGLDNLKKAQAKQKARYDLKHRAPTYKIGDKVLRRNRVRDTSKSGGSRFLPATPGQYYVITEQLGPKVYRLYNPFTKIYLQGSVNVDNLKLYQEMQTASVDSEVDDAEVEQSAVGVYAAAGGHGRKEKETQRKTIASSRTISKSTTCSATAKKVNEEAAARSEAVIGTTASIANRRVEAGIPFRVRVDSTTLDFCLMNEDETLETVYQKLAEFLRCSVEDFSLYQDGGGELWQDDTAQALTPNETIECIRRRRKAPEELIREQKINQRNMELVNTLLSPKIQALVPRWLQGELPCERSDEFTHWWNGGRLSHHRPLSWGPLMEIGWESEVLRIQKLYARISARIGGGNPIVKDNREFSNTCKVLNDWCMFAQNPIPPSTEAFIENVILYEAIKVSLCELYAIPIETAREIARGNLLDIYMDLEIDRSREAMNHSPVVVNLVPASPRQRKRTELTREPRSRLMPSRTEPAATFQTMESCSQSQQAHQIVEPATGTERTTKHRGEPETTAQPAAAVQHTPTSQPTSSSDSEEDEYVRKIKARTKNCGATRKDTGDYRLATSNVSGKDQHAVGVIALGEERRTEPRHAVDPSWICPICHIAYRRGAKMVACDTCNFWYHWKCVGIKQAPPKEADWNCRSCCPASNALV